MDHVHRRVSIGRQVRCGMSGLEQGTVAVAINRQLVDLARAAGLDPSRIAEHALRRMLGEAVADGPEEARRLDDLRRDIREEVAWYNEYTEEHGLFADDWRTFWCASSTCSVTRTVDP